MIVLAYLLRMLPLGVMAYVGARKGYPRLVTALFVLVAVSTFSTFTHPSDAVRGILGIVFVFFLVLHVLDLQDRSVK